MKNEITINLQDIDITGNILDISIKGNNIIPEIINRSEGEVEKDFVLWEKNKASMEEKFYDKAFALFSLGTIKGKRNLEDVIKEVSRVLKKGGRLFIWDITRKRMSLNKNYSIKVVLPQNRRGRIHIKTKFNPFKAQLGTFLTLLQKNNFKVILSSNNGNTFFIEAEKDGDVIVENSSGIA